MKVITLGRLIIALTIAVTACKQNSASSTKAIVTSDRKNAVAFIPMREYSTKSMLEIRAVSCGKDPSLSSGKPEILMNILESGVRIDPAALYYRGTILVTANDSLINIQGYAISHNCRVQLSVPAIGATGFYALFSDTRPEFDSVRQMTWLALRGPYQEGRGGTPTLDAFVSEVLQATRSPAKAARSTKILDERYNPCLPKTPNSAFNKLERYSCLRESGSNEANYLSKNDNLPEIRQKLKNLADEFANKQISESQIDQVADLFGMNFVMSGNMSIRKTGAVARLASFGLDRESASDSGLSLQGGNSTSDRTSILGSQTVTKFEPLTKGSGSLSNVNSEYHKRDSAALERVLRNSEGKSTSELLDAYSKGKKTAPPDMYPYSKMNNIINSDGSPSIWDGKPSHQYPIIAPRPSDPKPNNWNQLLVSPPQSYYQPKNQGGTGGYSIDTKKVPGFDPTKPGAVTIPKPFSGKTPVDVPDSKVDGPPAQGGATYASRCNDLGGTVVGVLCVCPDEGGRNGKVQGARLTVNPENPSEISCTRKREYLAQEQAKEASDEAKKKSEFQESIISKLDSICRSILGTLRVPADRIVKEGDALACICNNRTNKEVFVSVNKSPPPRCLTDGEIEANIALQKAKEETAKAQQNYDRAKYNNEKAEDCRNNRNGIGYDPEIRRCMCPSGWVYVDDDGKCHWASMAWFYKDAPKEVSHYERADKRPWLDRINPFKNFWDEVTKPIFP